jgi:Cu(I)/Ag(I) efflux system membrane fusion protein
MAAALPPGHPPLDQETLAAFVRSQSASAGQGKAAAGGDACGSCGMSAAAMAAGEPCNHDKS